MEYRLIIARNEMTGEKKTVFLEADNKDMVENYHFEETEEVVHDDIVQADLPRDFPLGIIMTSMC